MSDSLSNSKGMETNCIPFGILKTVKKLLNQTSILITINSKGQLIDVNESFSSTFNYSLLEIHMQDYSLLHSGYHSEEFWKAKWACLDAGEQWSSDLCMRAKDGRVIWLRSSFVPIQNNKREIIGYLSISTDITEQKMYAKWKYIAHHDELTNLPNRRMLNNAIESMITRSNRMHRKMAVLYMDINEFKRVNDTYSHSVGDLLLQEVGNRLKIIPSLNRNVFHLSGDEFIVLIEDVHMMEKHILSIFNVFTNTFYIGTNEIKVSVSIGTSMYPDDCTDGTMLVNLADIAMYHSKSKGGNRYSSFKTSLIP
ncbi:diguanylate cyclase domain-containing protein [Sporosarcina siberiensis]|uniref:Diguanylate cyclase domain-containing protein n=1 Tax=Sporosarcina siberiensis TaxID=1365606 RepID=A0ABW4SE75_9BACL